MKVGANNNNNWDWVRIRGKCGTSRETFISQGLRGPLSQLCKAAVIVLK